MRILLASVAVFIACLAEAHIVVEPKSTTAGSYAKLVFRVPHGCEGSPTNRLTVSIPDGFLSIKPQMKPGWKISIKKRKLETPITVHGKAILEVASEITWSGGEIPDEFMDEFGVSLKTPDRTGDFAFATVQTCKKGLINWSHVASTEASAEHSAHGSQFPAPLLRLEKAPGKP